MLSDDSHPFADVECIGVGMTTRDHPDAITVPDEAWVRGRSQTDAYISPWYVTTIKRRDLDNQQGDLANEIVADAVQALHGYTPVPNR